MLRGRHQRYRAREAALGKFWFLPREQLIDVVRFHKAVQNEHPLTANAPAAVKLNSSCASPTSVWASTGPAAASAAARRLT